MIMEIQPYDKNEKAMDVITHRCEVIEARAVVQNKKIAVLKELISQTSKTGKKIKIDADRSQLSYDNVTQESDELHVRAGPASRAAPGRMLENVTRQRQVNAALRSDITAARTAMFQHSSEMAKRIHEFRRRLEDYANENTLAALQRRYQQATQKLACFGQENAIDCQTNDQLRARLLDPARLTRPAFSYTEEQLLDILGLGDVEVVLKEVNDREEVVRQRVQAAIDAAREGGNQPSSWKY